MSYQNSLPLYVDLWCEKIIHLAVISVLAKLFDELSCVDRSICWFSLYHLQIRNNCARGKTASKHSLLDKAKAHILMGYDGMKSCVLHLHSSLQLPAHQSLTVFYHIMASYPISAYACLTCQSLTCHCPVTWLWKQKTIAGTVFAGRALT